MMQALVLQNENDPARVIEFPNPEVPGGNVLVKIQAAALNHRDIWIGKGKYPGITFPVILGSDGAGTLDGKEVMINPGLDWGGDENFQSRDFRVLGMPENGCFAEYISIPKIQVFPKPAHLTFEQAAALPLAGLTAFRALFSRAQIKKGEKVIISGIGGGVALTAMLFSLAVGAEVYVTSGSEDKIKKALGMGAIEGINYRESHWGKPFQKRTGGANVIIDSAGGAGFNELIEAAAPGCRIAIYGGSKGAVDGLSPQRIFWKQLSILGSTMGSPKEFSQMLEFVEKHEIVPVVDSVFPLQDAQKAFKRMEEGKQFGKIVLNI